MSQTKESKAWRKYQEGKSLVKARPEASWLGNLEGMFQDQRIRIRNAILKSHGIDVDLRNSMKIQFIQKFTHEDNFVAYIDKTYDIITKLSVHGTDDKPRKDQSLTDETIESDDHRKGVVE